MSLELNIGPVSEKRSESRLENKRLEVRSETHLDIEHWTQVFNTALISTRVENARASSSELYTLIQEPAFNALLSSIQLLATTKGVSELDAAKEMIQVFRKIDQVWSDLLIQEGFERLKGRS
jgi:hypothetical protein